MLSYPVGSNWNFTENANNSFRDANDACTVSHHSMQQFLARVLSSEFSVLFSFVGGTVMTHSSNIPQEGCKHNLGYYE